MIYHHYHDVGGRRSSTDPPFSTWTACRHQNPAPHNPKLSRQREACCGTRGGLARCDAGATQLALPLFGAFLHKSYRGGEAPLVQFARGDESNALVKSGSAGKSSSPREWSATEHSDA